ncbi:MAG: P27 family phage terminase small subunit [Erysipelotrichaceae bacterium]|nr:P27 family phage terminase small subunit [Erysipelotrichaceae bacterium]
MAKKKTMSWAITIRRLMKKAGIYEPHYEPVIKQLGDVLNIREKAMQQFKDEGEQLLVLQINGRGAENYVVNPLITRIEKADDTAINYWKELGFTAKAYNSLTNTVAAKEEKDSLGSILKKIGC